MPNAIQLITYADRLGGDIAGITSLLNNEFNELFSGVHLLPFFDPIDGADAGFDPANHSRVDPRLGNWNDISSLANNYSVMADLIVNHVSADSDQFKDVCRHGQKSPFWRLFLRKSDVFPNSGPAMDESEEIRRIYRPRPGSPFTPIRLDNGDFFDFWTTFSDKQLDINVESPVGRDYLTSILEKIAQAGIREIRLDAVGYAIKRRGTSCFMLPETFDFIAALSSQANDYGIETLVEIHSHYQTQIEIASQVGRVYDFALPPLVLHTLYNSDAGALKRWLKISPRNCVTVLDTHDGIGILDVAAQGELAGLLADQQIDDLIETIHKKTAGSSRKASGQAASNLDIYQVNSTYFDALGCNDTDYLLARAIQFFAPGTPQVYYVGMLAGENDLDLVERTGVGRDINRHYYTPDEIDAALQRPVVRNLMHEREVLVSIDLNIRLRASIDEKKYLDGVRSLLSEADIVKLSDEDLEAFELAPSTRESSEIMFEEMGPGLLVLTRGTGGAVLFSEQAVIESSSYPVPALVDTVGAGDAFHSAFLACLSRSGELSRPVSECNPVVLTNALKFACAAAAINVARSGCSPPTQQEVAELMLSSVREKVPV